MHLKKKKHAEQQSLTLAFSGFILLSFLVVTILVGIIIVLLTYGGTLNLGNSDFNMGRFLVQLLIWSLAVGSVLSFFLSRFLLSPVNKILNALNALAAGDYTARLSFKGPLSRISTLRRMTDSFNKMAAELEQTEMLRSDFINNFSHEFKTPIVSIAGFAKLLKYGAVGPEEQKEYLDVIEEESLRLSHMATNVLDLTRIENQNILTNQIRYNLSEQLRTCMLMLETKWSRKHIEPVLPLEEYYIYGNEELLKQVWINLFDNAIKYSQEYGSVTASIDTVPGGLNISVSNYGEVIPSDKIDKIYNKFYQADESHTAEGNGVGLAIVKKVVELHQGEIRAVSGSGKTTFTVFLPLEQENV